MKAEDKQLLLKDISGRLPYGVICEDMEGKTRPLFGITPTLHFEVTLHNATDGTNNGLKFCTIEDIKPYLRPMSSMTEEERIEYAEFLEDIDGYAYSIDCVPQIDWLNAHHFDFRNLIERGLAIEVTEENNPYKD